MRFYFNSLSLLRKVLIEFLISTLRVHNVRARKNNVYFLVTMVVSKNISESTETNCQFGDFFLIYAEELGAKDWIGHEDED